MLADADVDRWYVCPRAGHILPSERRDDSVIVNELIAANVNRTANPTDATDEMIEAVNVLYRAIADDHGHHSPITGGVLETIVWGGIKVTPTLWYKYADDTISIFNFEYGHSYVEHYESKRSILCAQAVAAKLGLVDPVVRMYVVQPRCYQAEPVRKWMRLISQLGEMTNYIVEAAKVSKDAEHIRHAGTHCKRCKEIVKCKANSQCAAAACDVILTHSVDTDADLLALEYDVLTAAKKIVDDRISAIESRVQYGNKMPAGFATDRTRGTVKWNDTDQAKTMAMVHGVDISKNDIKTPKQAIDAGMPEEVVAQLSKRVTKQTIKRVTPLHIRKALEP